MLCQPVVTELNSLEFVKFTDPVCDYEIIGTLLAGVGHGRDDQYLNLGASRFNCPSERVERSLNIRTGPAVAVEHDQDIALDECHPTKLFVKFACFGFGPTPYAGDADRGNAILSETGGFFFAFDNRDVDGRVGDDGGDGGKDI